MSQLDIWGTATRLRADATSAEPVRSVTACFAAGVVVITVGTGSRVHGMTVSTLSTVARTPPLISVALRGSSTCLAQVKEDGVFAVSALSVRQVSLARYFADPLRRPGLSQPSMDTWLIGPAGSIPVLQGAIGWLSCQTEMVIPVHDHELIIAQVRRATPGHGLPLVQLAGDLRDDLPLSQS